MEKKKSLGRVFFAKNRTQALARLRMLEIMGEKGLKNKTVILSKTQVPHIVKWKTWKIINVRKRK